MCTYCGLPFVSIADIILRFIAYMFQANEHHRAHLESLPETPYPLSARGDAAEINESQKVTDEPMAQR